MMHDPGRPRRSRLVALTAFMLVAAGCVQFGAGRNNDGQFGDGNPVLSEEEYIQLFGAANVLDVSAGFDSSCRVRRASGVKGTIECAGKNDDGELGDGTNIDRDTYGAIASPKDDWIDVAGSFETTCAVDFSKTGYCWGAGTKGELGNGTLSDSNVPVEIVGVDDLMDIDVANDHGCAVEIDGDAYCWGFNFDGELGAGLSINISSLPVEVSGGHDFEDVAVGRGFSCGVTASNDLHCWGSNLNGRLGTGSASASENEPVLVGSGYAEVALGWDHACALTTAGSIKCWGRNDLGQLGLGDNTDRSTPVDLGVGVDWKSLGLGALHTCAIDDSNQLWCTGFNEGGQLGLGDQVDRNTLTKVGVKTDWLQVSGGFDFTLARSSPIL